MNKIPASRLVLQGFLAAITFSMVACDSSSSIYATAAAARADGAVVRGWLPAELPDSAVSISETHDLDTNVGSGSFSFAAAETESFRAKLRPASPADLQKFRNAEELQRGGYSFYVVPGFILAVNWQSRHVRYVIAHGRES
ncbi:MAG TPA: hypothetical protein VF585_03340 [Chthoniobacterales bacterium]